MPIRAIATIALGLGLYASAPLGGAVAGSLGTCPGADQVEAELKNSGSSGYYIPGLKLIILNKTVLDSYSEPVRKFIFAHECAHSDAAIGTDEAEADCAAVKKGVSEGWIGRPEVIQVCAHLARFPADRTHAPLPARCSYIRQCSGLWDDPAQPKAAKPEQTAKAQPARTVPDSTPLTRLARTMD